MVGIDSDIVYATCKGKIYRTGYDKSYGNYVVVKEDNANRYHWFCHLASILKKSGAVSQTTKLGIMGATGNVTGKHTHYEIRNASNKYGDDTNPATFMGIPNQVGTYNSNDYQINQVVKKFDTGEEKILNAKIKIVFEQGDNVMIEYNGQQLWAKANDIK